MSRIVKPKTELSDQETPRPSSSTFAQLSRRIARSDRDAFRELFEELHPALIRFAWRYTRDADTSRDIVQDAFVKVWEKRETLDPSKSILGFMYTVVRNRALNLSRDSHYTNSVDADEVAIEDVPTPDEQADFGILEKKIHEWIDNLPKRRREAFKLSRFEGLTHAEIAQVMNLTPRTVNTHVMLALRDLRGKLKAFRKDTQAI